MRVVWVFGRIDMLLWCGTRGLATANITRRQAEGMILSQLRARKCLKVDIIAISHDSVRTGGCLFNLLYRLLL